MLFIRAEKHLLHCIVYPIHFKSIFKIIVIYKKAVLIWAGKISSKLVHIPKIL